MSLVSELSTKEWSEMLVSWAVEGAAPEVESLHTWIVSESSKAESL